MLKAIRWLRQIPSTALSLIDCSLTLLPLLFHEFGKKQSSGLGGNSSQSAVQIAEVFLQNRIVLGQNGIERFVLRNCLQRDVGNGLAYEALFKARSRLTQLIEVECAGDQSLACDSYRHTACINRDPTPPPLLSHVSSRAGPAGWVEYYVARFGGHQHASLDDLRSGLHDIDLATGTADVGPVRANGCGRGVPPQLDHPNLVAVRD